VQLVPVGVKPDQAAAQNDNPLTPVELGKQILDDSIPRDRREALVRKALAKADEVVWAMTVDLDLDETKEEYRRIPWVWRVAIAAGRANDAKVLPALLEVSLPKVGEPLRDWQAVVLGGGIINGLSLEGVWPAARLQELIKARPDLAKRWTETLKLAHTMADAEKVPTGTRYDALRIVALDTWASAKPRLLKYLGKAADTELQQGAVSGLVDVTDPEAGTLLVNALAGLTEENRKFAVEGLLRTPGRITTLLTAIEKGAAKREWLSMEQRAALLKHPDETVRARAAKLLGKP
jgi:hypothetical protein